ncbi:MAG: hypothetical protein AB7E81_00495 [Hyphomicrobiaceae bacterium]
MPASRAIISRVGTVARPRRWSGRHVRLHFSDERHPQARARRGLTYVLESTVPVSHITEDALVIFEVLSRSNTKADQEWRRKVYASVPNCQHYVTVSLQSPEVVAFDLAGGWECRSATGPTAVLELPALALALALADIYRYTPLADRAP